MSTILGLDLGTNSIGWALINNTTSKIIGVGSRVFSEGVVDLGGGEGKEMSKNASRTVARGVRRQLFRRRLRKRYLLKELAKHQLCPIAPEALENWNQTTVFDTEVLKKWFQLNPYELRAKAIKAPISLHEIGRIFYHMIQRRGFLSNSRSAGAATKETSAIFKGDLKQEKVGIASTQQSIAQSITLGSYLHTIQPKEHAPYVKKVARIRNRYTTRQMYIDEFEMIWEFQKQFHAVLTNSLKTHLGGRKKDGYKKDGILFHQRPLRSQKHLVGNCTLEPKKTKASISSIPFEYFRIYQWINTLACDFNGNHHPISQKERHQIITLLLSAEKVAFKKIRKAIGKTEKEYQFNYKDDAIIYGTYTISNLSNKKFFGKQWFNFTQEEQENIWHILSFFDDREKLKNYAMTHWQFTEEKAIKISKFNLKEGYANLSRKAINGILPFLKEGFMYDVAVALAGVKNALGNTWQTHQEFVKNNVPEIVRANIKGGYLAPLKKMLAATLACTPTQLKKLYHHSSAIKATTIAPKLPVGDIADKEIQKIKNPIVIKALFEVRKLVNELITTYGKPDEIKIELARDLKTSKKNRYEIRKQQQFLEKENNRIQKELENLAQRATPTNILKYKLWEECNHTCPYTNTKIPIHKLFTGEIQIEHIYPWSRSLNDSFMNKTLCYANENRAKKNKTPYEFYHDEQGEEKWAQVKQQALACFKNKYPNYPNAYNKFKHFVQKKREEDFVSRQLNDTRYISKEAKNYLSKISNNVLVASGQATAALRHHWGLNNILNEVENAKTRHDHRHHAIDALVMACITAGHVQALSQWNRYDRNYELKDFAMPWPSFRVDAAVAIAGILVSHKKEKKLLTVRKHTVIKNGQPYTNKGIAARGLLHKESVYGKRKAPGKEEAYHIRKPIESITTEKKLEKVVDPTIKNLIFKRIQKLGGFVKGKIPSETFYKLAENGQRVPQIFLPNKNGAPVPIKKVRIREVIGKAVPLKNTVNQYVNPQNNHHILIYKNAKGIMAEEVVSFWEAVERKKQEIDVFKMPKKGKEKLAILQKNDMFVLGLDIETVEEAWQDNSLLKEHLYKVQKISSKDYNFRKHSDARPDEAAKKEYIRITSLGEGKKGWKTMNPIKVKLNSIGKIVKA